MPSNLDITQDDNVKVNQYQFAWIEDQYKALQAIFSKAVSTLRII